MALEFLKQESVTRQEQKAFSSVANALIFEKPVNLTLSKRNIPEISHAFQEAFYEQDEAHKAIKEAYVKEMVDRTVRNVLGVLKKHVGEDKKTDKAPEVPEPQVEEKQPEPEEEKSAAEQFMGMARMYAAMSKIDDSYGYNAWGFTPKLAGLHSKKDSTWEFEKDGKNCFGVVQGLAARTRRMGLPFQMGITSDHPFLIADIEGKKYLASLHGAGEAKGKFEEHDGFKTYVPSPEDNISYKLMVVWDFDEGLVYEMLENLEVLRKMSLGESVENLPRTEDRGKEIANEYKGVLQAAQWRELQQKLMPDLSRYFRDHAKEWDAEQQAILINRHINSFFKDIMLMGHASTSMKDLEFTEFRKKFLPLAKENGPAIAAFVAEDAEFGVDVPEDVVAFARRAKKILSSIKIPAIREEVTKAFLKPFAQQEEIDHGEEA